MRVGDRHADRGGEKGANRREFLRKTLRLTGGGALAATGMAGILSEWEDRTEAAAGGGGQLTMTAFGGSWQQVLKKDVVGPFEQATGSTVSLITGTGVSFVSRLELANGHPGIDIIYLDPVPFYIVRGRNLIQKLDMSKIPNAKDLYPIAVDKGHYWLGFGIGMAGIVYNTERVKKPPASWLDLWDPMYKGHLALPYVTQTSGYTFLVEVAKLHGGSERNVDPGFEAIRRLKRNVVAFYKNPDGMATLLTSGDAWLGPWYNDRFNQLKKAGAPLGFVRPREGVIAYVGTVSVPVGAAKPDLAMRFINYFLDASVQGRWAADLGAGPTNRKVTLPPRVTSLEIPYGADVVSSFAKLDYQVIAANLPGWISRWQKEIAE